MKRIKICRLPLAVLMVLLAFRISAQELRPVSSTYAIERARIVQSPGNIIESGTVLITNGLIVAVGAGIEVPPDAIKIAADSMTVYAGFIDGLSHTGIPQPKENQNQGKVKDPGNPPNERAGITPEITVRDVMDQNDASVEGMRKLGFTLVHTAPHGHGMLPGHTGLILLSGDDRMVFQEEFGLHARLDGARGVYPNTVIGVMAKFRELYRQAQITSSDGKRFEENPLNMRRPSPDPVVESFNPVLSEGMPVVFSTEDVKSIQRAMALKRDLGFQLILADIKQGWDLTSTIKSSNTPVFLSLDLPEWKEEVDDSTNTIDDDKEALVKRQVDFIRKQYTQPAAWSAAGINFGFSTNGAKSADIHKHLLKMKEAGVSEEVLLAGLTTQPARLLGISGMAGTVEPGKMANLVVSDKNYFEEDAKVRYVMVEGKLFEYNDTPAGKDESKGDDTPAGTWTYVAETPGGNGTGTIEIKKGTGNSYTGKLTDSQTGYSYDLDNLKVEDNTLSFDFMYSDGANELPVSVSATIDGSSFSGMVDASGAGSFPITGQKKPKNR